jgi:hypothetical protein
MTLTLAEIARWHARQAKATKGADRDFHAEAVRLLWCEIETFEQAKAAAEQALAKPLAPDRKDHAAPLSDCFTWAVIPASSMVLLAPSAP